MSELVPLILSALATGGVLGGVIALIKLPGDRSAGAVTTIAAVQAELRGAWMRARRRAVYWKIRAKRAEALLFGHAIPLPPEPLRAEVDAMLESEADDEELDA